MSVMSGEGVSHANRLETVQPTRPAAPVSQARIDESTRAFAERFRLPLWTLEFSDRPPSSRWRPPQA